MDDKESDIAIMGEDEAVNLPPLLQLRDVSKRFGGVQALDNIQFDVLKGEVICLAGENGCGKSTLIKIVSGVHQPESGAIMQWDGDSILGLDPAKARALGIQVIWQDLALFAEMSVAENIAFELNLGRGIKLINRQKMHEVAGEALKKLDVDINLEATVSSLNIAKRQLVAIARALIAEARLIFMDEPTASLSQQETDALLDIVRKLSAQGIAVVFVSHRLAEVLEICTRVTVVRDGKYVGTYPTEGMSQSRLTELMTGNQFDYAPRAKPENTLPPILQVINLSRGDEYQQVSLEVAPGEIVGLTGKLGSGRTELAMSLFGLTRPDEGSILFNGDSMDFRSNRDAINAGIAYVSEDRLSLGLIQPQSISDNTVISVLDKLQGVGGLLSEKLQSNLTESWIDRLKVKIGSPLDAVSTLSGGNQQRIVLAKWLATGPQLLILDSPTVGVDVGARAGIFEVVHELAASGMAILLISDEPHEVFYNTDRILHMKDGQIIEQFIPSEIDLHDVEEAINA